MSASKNLGGRPKASAYLDALYALQGRGTIDEIWREVRRLGLSPTRDAVYARLKQLQAEGRVNQETHDLFSLPSAAPTADARLDALLTLLVRSGVIPYDHSI